MRAYIVFKTDLSSIYCGAGPYILITEDGKVIGEHWCSSRGFANHDIPAWSLHRLLCMLPKHIQVYDEVWKFKRNLYLSIDEDFNIRYEENIDEPCFDKIFWAYDIYQNCIDAIEWLIKEGHFNKEYLENGDN